MPRSWAFVAAGSNSGKTTLLEKVIPILTGRALRVAVIKHAHERFDIDHPGKDSYRFTQAGAETVLVSSRRKMAMIRRVSDERPLSSLLPLVTDHDLVFIEGYRREAECKLEGHREGAGRRPMCLDDPSFKALVTDGTYSVSIPTFHLDDAAGVADFILRSFDL